MINSNEIYFPFQEGEYVAVRGMIVDSIEIRRKQSKIEVKFVFTDQINTFCNLRTIFDCAPKYLSDLVDLTLGLVVSGLFFQGTVNNSAVLIKFSTGQRVTIGNWAGDL